MLSRAVRLTTVGDIDIRLAPSMAVIVALVVWAFTSRFTPTHSLPAAIGMALVFAVLFFATILAHELAHALEARHRGIEVHGITLLLFGGVTEMHAHSERPRDEFVIAAVGPYVSVLCAAVFGLVATFAAALLPGALGSPVAEVAGLLAWWNLALAVFNLVPGAPLDGGRVLRAVLWWMLGDRLRALRISVRCGQALGIGLAGFGLWVLTRTPQAAFGAGLFIVLGLFLFTSARTELRHAETDAALEGQDVGSLLGSLPVPIPANGRLDTLDLEAYADGAALIPVTDDGVLIGVLDVAAIRELHPADRSIRTAGELADAVDGLPIVALSDDLHTLIERFQGAHHVVCIARDGTPVAALTEREAARAIAALRRGVRR